MEGDVTLKIYDAMMLKREIGTNCKIDANILETLKDGFVIRIMENSVNENSLEAIIDFVNKHELKMLFDSGVYFISNQILAPLEPIYLSE
jgi:hypothetical protein